ncbi:MAG: diguanylate cyclase [Clostridia bacterium]
MNILSMISTVIYTFFFIGAALTIRVEKKNILKWTSIAVLTSLGWWSFCNAFFFAADTVEQAWCWHKLSSIGWCGFVPLTSYYFLTLVNDKKKKAPWWKQLLFFTPAVVLIARNLFGDTTSLAQNIVQSTSGWGWTYENSISSFWLWAYLLYVALYLGLSFFLLYKWGKAAKHKMKKEMASGFIVLDCITILFGIVTDVIFPLTRPILPALASVGAALFGIGYFGIVCRFDIFNIDKVISAEDILKISSNPLLIVDESMEILKCNIAAEHLLGYDKNELMGENLTRLTSIPIAIDQFSCNDQLTNVVSQMHCKDGNVKDVLLSTSIANDSRNSFICIIVSCQDITKEKKTQDELELAREKYKRLADDYQKLANYDSLTGLPNRRCFFDALSNYEKQYETEKKDFTILFFDLDNFKYINDLYGHAAGDRVLIAAADKLKACMGKDEFIARLGGDEFMMIIPVAEAASIDNKMRLIHDAFSQSILLNGAPYQIHVSIGFGIFSQAKNTINLMQIADEAMYVDKQKSKA